MPIFQTLNEKLMLKHSRDKSIVFELGQSGLSQQIEIADNGFSHTFLKSVQSLITSLILLPSPDIFLKLSIGLFKLDIFIEESSVELLVFIAKLIHLVLQFLIFQSEIFHLLFIGIHFVNFLTIRMIQFLIFLLH